MLQILLECSVFSIFLNKAIYFYVFFCYKDESYIILLHQKILCIWEKFKKPHRNKSGMADIINP